MAEPQRVRVQGDLFHGRVPDGAVYVGRAAPGLKQSPYRNPHRVGKPCAVCAGAVHTLDESLDLYDAFLDDNPELVRRARQDLAGRDLACWCKLTARCHGDGLLRRINDRPDLDDWCEDCLEPLCVCMAMYGPAIVDVPTRGLL